MLLGTYRKINWNRYLSAELDLEKNYIKRYYPCTCGTSALALLTSHELRYVDKHLPGNRKDWTDSAACNFLRCRGFVVITLTKFGVTSNPYPTYESIRWPINKYHVLLCNQLVCKDEGSWFVIHKEFCWHQMEKEPLNPLHFINRPIQSIFLVWHRKWA